MFGVGIRLFLLFTKFALIKIPVKTVKLQNIIAIYACDVKLNFQHHYFSIQCHMILQK